MENYTLFAIICPGKKYFETSFLVQKNLLRVLISWRKKSREEAFSSIWGLPRLSLKHYNFWITWQLSKGCFFYYNYEKSV